ncbi:hypothetical protein OIU77_019097 [Salix suchowensis]|uniref:Uncharacterized protein n=1 Tax=Salix suchowensis TaxID=1278906 RepID=A0ABQ9CFV8_9ROSI|nr:hypothetical protein OIU77_019097 [Salix suchowensis]
MLPPQPPLVSSISSKILNPSSILPLENKPLINVSNVTKLQLIPSVFISLNISRADSNIPDSQKPEINAL